MRTLVCLSVEVCAVKTEGWGGLGSSLSFSTDFVGPWEGHCCPLEISFLAGKMGGNTLTLAVFFKLDGVCAKHQGPDPGIGQPSCARGSLGSHMEHHQLPLVLLRFPAAGTSLGRCSPVILYSPLASHPSASRDTGLGIWEPWR